MLDATHVLSRHDAMQVIVGKPGKACTSYLLTPFLDGYTVQITYQGEGVAAFDHAAGKMIGLLDESHNMGTGAMALALLEERGGAALVREIPAYYRRKMMTPEGHY